MYKHDWNKDACTLCETKIAPAKNRGGWKTSVLFGWLPDLCEPLVSGSVTSLYRPPFTCIRYRILFTASFMASDEHVDQSVEEVIKNPLAEICCFLLVSLFDPDVTMGLMYPPKKMNECPVKRDHFKRKVGFRPSLFRGYVSFCWEFHHSEMWTSSTHGLNVWYSYLLKCVDMPAPWILCVR